LRNPWLGKLQAFGDVRVCVRGVYCLLIYLSEDRCIGVGALGHKQFERGCYVYVGSAMSGIEQRVRRHKSSSKTLKWHIDYLLTRSDLLASIAIQSASRKTECETVESLSKCEDAAFPVPRFGSSGCRCKSHLLYFGDVDPAQVMEMLMMRLSMLESAYPRVFE